MESAFLPIHMVIVRKKGIVTPCEELLSFFMKFVWLLYYSTVLPKNKEFCKNIKKSPIFTGFGIFPKCSGICRHFTMLAKKIPMVFSYDHFQGDAYNHHLCLNYKTALAIKDWSCIIKLEHLFCFNN